MKRFLYFKTKTYRSRDYQDYINNMDNNSGEGIDETELWKQEETFSSSEETNTPKPFVARVAIDPDLIISYIETCSIEEYYKNKENPKFDCIDIMLADGINITVIGTLDEFEQQLMMLNR